MVVRIYDHAGKINLNRIPRRNMQLLIEKQLGGIDADPEEVQDLLAAWTDWTDLNDLESLNGAERDYYMDREQGYTPRNNPELDSVEELLHVRGFAELFEGVNLDAAFTIYGNTRTVNLNVATREAMRLLPGLDDELVETIIAYRELEDINNQGSEEDDTESIEREDSVRQAYMEIVEVRSGTALPTVYKVDPYGLLPDTAKARVDEYGIEL